MKFAMLSLCSLFLLNAVSLAADEKLEFKTVNGLIEVKFAGCVGRATEVTFDPAKNSLIFIGSAIVEKIDEKGQSKKFSSDKITYHFATKEFIGEGRGGTTLVETKVAKKP